MPHAGRGKGITRRTFATAGTAAALSAALPRTVPAQKSLILNDASGLNPTPVFSHWIARTETDSAFIERLRKELKAAAEANRPVAVGAARHSMGGQSLPRNGSAMTFNINRCEPDRAAKAYRVHAGTRWAEVIASLDTIGFSPAVTQSNHDFGVGATFSVNAHGWPVPYGPMGSTVRAFRLMLADGTVLTCSRNENPELFRLVMGGYGLFGVILDLDVEMTENVLLRSRFAVMPAEDFAKRFVAAESDPAVRMAYGRLNVTHSDFFSEAVLVTFHPERTPPDGLPPLRHARLAPMLTRQVYRAQLGSERNKRARWFAETVVVPKSFTGVFTRNSLMNEPVANLANRDPKRTDILHEYFIAPERFNEFIQGCRSIIPKAQADFLNVTLRYVRKDETSVLAYATTSRIAAVMSFSLLKTAEGEADMQRTTKR